MMGSEYDEMMDIWMAQSWDNEEDYQWVYLSEMLLGLQYPLK
jgi:hypothetical protein